MNNYNVSQIQKTVSTLVIIGVIASIPYNTIPQKKDSELRAVPYRANAISKTAPYYQTNTFPLTQQTELQFETVLTNFIAQLSSQQEDLEEDFQNVLINNLWDLYQT